MWRVLAIWLLLASPTLADAVAIIDGPKTGRVGDLIVLDGSQSVGDGFRWIVPEGLQTLNCGQGGPGQLAFASGKAAAYTFTLIAADKEASIDYVTHTVTITGGLQPTPTPDPEPDPVPDDPTPTPVPVLEQLEKLSRESAARLADEVTAKGLADAILATDAQIESMCASGQCPGLSAAKQMMVVAIERRLLAREGASRNVNWLDGWRKPINEAISRLNAVDVPSYRAVMRAVASGLRG